MLLHLKRTYFPEGTQGIMTYEAQLVCKTIELPWKGNQRRISCIPEGEYVLQRWYSTKFKWHLRLNNVPGRDGILIHPANDALKELKGCIAPVSRHTGIGKGVYSRKALDELMKLVQEAFERSEEVRILIEKK